MPDKDCDKSVFIKSKHTRRAQTHNSHTENHEANVNAEIHHLVSVQNPTMTIDIEPQHPRWTKGEPPRKQGALGIQSVGNYFFW
jgi:hypothetical protein